MKFEKPFSSFSLSSSYKPVVSLKERWKIALSDPAYLAVWVLILTSIIFLFL